MHPSVRRWDTRSPKAGMVLPVALPAILSALSLATGDASHNGHASPPLPPAVIFGYELPAEVSWPRLVVFISLFLMAVVHSLFPQRPPGISVAELWVYPIKGCHGVRVQSVTVDRLGFQNDRRLMVGCL